MKYQKKKFINNTKKSNRREAGELITATYRAFLLMGIMALHDEFISDDNS